MKQGQVGIVSRPPNYRQHSHFSHPSFPYNYRSCCSSNSGEDLCTVATAVLSELRRHHVRAWRVCFRAASLGLFQPGLGAL